MSTIAEKATQEVPATNYQIDVHHNEIAEKGSSIGFNGTTEEDEQFQFTFGKFLAIAVSTVIIFSDSSVPGRTPRAAP